MQVRDGAIERPRPSFEGEPEAGTPLATIVVPTRNRPDLLPAAVESALAQRVADAHPRLPPPVEVIVVDDASDPPVRITPDPRLRIVRLDRHAGGAAARNAGLRRARGRWITFLDDDDRLLAHMLRTSLDAIARSRLPQPVAALSGIEVVDAEGRVQGRRIPTTRIRGEDFFLEEPEPGRTYLTKQTLVVEAHVLRGLGGFDESFRSRVHTELFLRLNPVCSLEAVPQITYRHVAHAGERVSSDARLRQESFRRLLRKHRSAFARHGWRSAEFVLDHAARSRRQGQPWTAGLYALQAFRLHPRATLRRLVAELRGS